MSDKPITVASFFQFLKEKKLMGTRCKGCSTIYLPPRAICPENFSDDMEWVELSGKGKLVAFTSVYIAPTFMEKQGYGRKNPYCTGIVELQEGVKISARITGVDASQPEEIQIGASVTLDFLEVSSDDEEDKEVYLAFRVE